MYQRFERLHDGNGDEIGFRIYGLIKGVPYMEVMYADIPGNSWNQNRLNKFTDRANQLLQTVIPLADLPADDPDRLADPGLPGAYWDGDSIVYQSVQVSDVRWDETGATPRLVFTLSGVEN